MKPRFAAQFARLKTYLSDPDADTGWSTYPSVRNALREVEELEPGIIEGDISAKTRMRYLLAPTGVLQEISMANGWAEEFLEIASILDGFLS